METCVAGRPRVHGGSGAGGGAGLHCQLPPAHDSTDGGQMKNLMLAVAALSLAAAGCNQKTFPVAPPAGTEMSRAVIEPYLKIQASLANDTTDDIHANAGTIATAATA